MVRRPRRANLPNTCLPYTTLFSSARRDQPRGRRARPRRGPNGGDGPLPEDRVRPAARGALMGRLQLRHHLRQAAPGAALMSEEDKRRNRDFGFETRMIHAGTQPEPVTGARQTPIFQNTAYVFHDADHAASLFNLQTFGFIYSRLTNPTVAALEERDRKSTRLKH